ncbi:MAG: OmpA family protein [Saprospiraceae bacterium]
MSIRQTMLSTFVMLSLQCLQAQPYRVQLAAFNEKIDNSYFFNLGINEAYLRQDRNDIYRYFQGDFITQKDADDARRDALLKGLKFARVINLAELEESCDASCPVYQSRRHAISKASHELYLQSIFFNFNQKSLTRAAREELDRLILVFKKNPHLDIQLLAHTDAIGSKEYNLALSKKRARSTKAYLLSRGIPIERLKIKAFGESVPLAVNQKENGNDEPRGRFFNRRVVLALIDHKGAIVFEDKDFKEVPLHLKINQEMPPELLMHALMQN